MPVSNHLRRLLLQTIADNINEVIIGFDGTPATSDDGSAGRPAVSLTPTVTIIDDTDFTPVARYTTKPIIKSNTNELQIEIIIEVA